MVSGISFGDGMALSELSSSGPFAYQDAAGPLGGAQASGAILFATSSAEAIFLETMLPSAAMMARPQAEVSAFMTSESLVKFVLPGKGSEAMAMPGRTSSGER